MKSLLNRKAVKEFSLDTCKKVSKRQFTRVSKEWIEAIEADVRNSIFARVESHPSLGKTLKI